MVIIVLLCWGWYFFLKLALKYCEGGQDDTEELVGAAEAASTDLAPGRGMEVEEQPPVENSPFDPNAPAEAQRAFATSVFMAYYINSLGGT